MNRTPANEYDRLSCELITQYRSGDVTAFDQLAKLSTRIISRTIKHVVGPSTARNFHWREDLRQMAYLALANAIKPGNYDPERTRFSTYVFKAICSQLGRYSITKEALISTPEGFSSDILRDHAKTIRRVAKAEGTYSAPSDSMVGLVLRSLTAPDDVFQAVADREELQTTLPSVMAILTDEQQDIVWRVIKGQTTDSIGLQYEITGEAVRRRYLTAIKQLKRYALRKDHTINSALEINVIVKRETLSTIRQQAVKQRILKTTLTQTKRRRGSDE